MVPGPLISRWTHAKLLAMGDRVDLVLEVAGKWQRRRFWHRQLAIVQYIRSAWSDFHARVVVVVVGGGFGLVMEVMAYSAVAVSGRGTSIVHTWTSLFLKFGI